MSETITWCGHEWLRRMRWGNSPQPNEKSGWDDPDAVTTKNGALILKTRHNPKQFETENGPVTAKIGVGLVSCTTEFGYGRFEIEAKLPHGPYLWPAFWLWSFQSWPPEIDVFEAYSNKKSSYFINKLDWDIFQGGVWRVASNVHLGATPDNYNLGAKNHWLGLTSPDQMFHRYAVEWTADRIEIFFDGCSVRKITKKSVLKQFHGHTMNVVINNGLQNEHQNTSIPPTEMVVNWFRYIKF